MPGILTTTADVRCMHGGKVLIIPSQLTTTAGGKPVLVYGDLNGRPIVGCTQPTTPVSAPCTMTTPMVVGQSLLCSVGGRQVLLDTATGATNGVPPGLWRVMPPAQTNVDVAR